MDVEEVEGVRVRGGAGSEGFGWGESVIHIWVWWVRVGGICLLSELGGMEIGNFLGGRGGMVVLSSMGVVDEEKTGGVRG